MNVSDSRLTGLAGATVLVTGAFGLVGSRIVHALRTVGAEPLAVGRRDAYGEPGDSTLSGLAPTDPDVIVGDIHDAALMDDLASRADYIVHAAALADVAECTRNPVGALHANVAGTQSVLDAATRHVGTVKRMVFVSSASVYGRGAGTSGVTARFAEDDALLPMSTYANTKVWGEYQTALALDAVGASYAVVRYFSVYGQPQIVKENSHSWVVAWFGMRAALGLPLFLNGGGAQVRDMVHVDDIAEGTLLAALEPGAHRMTVNIGTGRATSVKEIAAMVAAHYSGTQILDAPMPEGDPRHASADTTRMSNLLHWTPGIGVEAGVAGYLEWLDRTPGAIPAWLRYEAA